MGIYYGNYLGAYVVVKNIIEEVEYQTRVCSNCGEDYSNQKNKFCSDCGKEVITSQKTEQEEIMFHDETGLLYSPEYPNGYKEKVVYLISNYKNIGQIDLPDPQESDVLELPDAINPEVYINDLKEHAAEVFKTLEEEGFEYEIKFGYMTTAS